MADRSLDIPIGLRFSCRQCGQCCRGLTVSLLPGEAERLEGYDWVSASPRLAGKQLFVQASSPGGLAPPLLQLAQLDGSCVFLEENHNCLIHDRLGYDAKPLACRQFPLVFVEGPSGVVVSASFACPTVVENLGGPLSEQGVEIRALLEDPLWEAARGRGVQLSGRLSIPERVMLTAEKGLDSEGYQALESAMLAILEDSSHTLTVRLLALGRLVEGVLAKFGKGIGGQGSPKDWREWMASEADMGQLFEPAAAGAGSPARQRAILAPVISLVEARWAAERGIAQIRGVLGQAMALAQGRGRVLLPSLSVEIPLEAMSYVRFDQDSSSADALMVRYLRECLRRKVLLRQPTVRKGVQYLLIYSALIRWYSVALAVSRGQHEVGMGELLAGIQTVERCYVHHNLLPRVLAEQATVTSLMTLLTDLVASPVDLATNFYRNATSRSATIS